MAQAQGHTKVIFTFDLNPIELVTCQIRTLFSESPETLLVLIKIEFTPLQSPNLSFVAHIWWALKVSEAKGHCNTPLQHA